MKFDIDQIKPHRSLRVLKAAEELIIERGYAGANLDEIVERAACSKSTVYEFFGGKEGLLITLCQRLTSELQEQFESAIDFDMPVEEGLYVYAKTALERILSERHIAFVRTMLVDSTHSPQVAKIYYETGPQTGIEQVARYLKQRAEPCGLEIIDTLSAARDFYGFIYTHLYARLFGAEQVLSKAQLEQESRRISTQFMKLYLPSE